MRQFHSTVIFLFIVIFAICKLPSNVVCQNENEYRLPDTFTPKIYDLSIRVDIGLHSFNGSVTIDARVNRATVSIDMHKQNLTITEKEKVQVHRNGILEAESVMIQYNENTEIMKIILNQTLSANTDYNITIKFNGRIEYDMKGLYMSSYYDGNVKYIATTFSAAAYARKIFPCFDEPSFKAKFRLKIECRNNFIALANTRVTNVEYVDDFIGTWSIVEFAETVPMSTYLLAFTVSDFKNITNNDELEFSVYASSKEFNNMEFALDVGREAIKALEEYTGLPYALDKMDFIAIDDFLYGAMENWGLISYKTSRIVNPNGKRNRRIMQDIISIISHEIVHQWFGNLVTCQWWSYVWLNEGFASYLEYIISDKIRPDWRILEQFSVEDMQPVMLNDVTPKTHAMTRSINTVEEITKIYDFVAYPKAASVIRMIEHIMTPAVFQQGLKLYLSERQMSTATEEHLFDALNRTQMQSETKIPSIAAIFRNWSNNPGFPILNVNYSRDEKIAKISQELFMPLINETESSDFFILYNYVTSQRASANYWLPEQSEWHWLHNVTETEHAVELGENQWMIFNLQQTGYYRVNYDNDNWNAIINSLDSNTFYVIHVLNRAQLLDDSFNLAKSGYLNFNITLSMLKYLRREYELMPITTGFRAIQFFLTYLDNQPFYNNLISIMREITDEIYVRINNVSHPEYPKGFSENYHQNVKLKVNLLACRFGAPSCVQDARNFMFLDDSTTLQIKQPSADDRPHIFCGALQGDLADNHWTQLKSRLLKMTTSIELYRDNQDEINDILYAFSNCDNSLVRVEIFLMDIFNKSQSPSYDIITKDDATRVIGNLIKSSSKHRELVLDFYMDRFTSFNETVPFTATLSAFAEAINDESHLERLKEIGIQYDVDVDSAILVIERNIYWSSKKVPEIALWIENEKGSAIKLNISIMTIIFFISIMILQ